MSDCFSVTVLDEPCFSVSVNDGSGACFFIKRDFTDEELGFVSLLINKTASPETQVIGGGVTFTINVENIGDIDAESTNVIDQLPTGFSYVSSFASQGSYNNLTGIWTIGTLAVGQSVSLDIVTIVTSSGAYTNVSTLETLLPDLHPENTESEITPEILPDELPIEGFSTIKCVQAHGLNNLAIIGMYQLTPNDPLVGVFAKVQYVPSTIGGISEITGVSYYEELSYYNITIDDIERLDGWDLESENSSICIVLTDQTTIWFGGGALLEEQSRQINSGEDPYFEEDTYGIHLGASERLQKTIPNVVRYWKPEDGSDINDNCGMWTYPAPCEDATVRCQDPVDFSVFQRNSFNYYVSNSQADLTEVQSAYVNVFYKIRYFTTDYHCPEDTYTYDKFSTMDMLRKRKDLVLLMNVTTGKLLIYDNYNQQLSEDTIPVVGPSGLWIGVSFDWYRGSFLPDPITEIVFSPTTIIKKTFLTNDYFVIVNDSGLNFTALDGSIEGSVGSSTNMTLVGGVALEADGTNVLTQTILANEIP